MVGSPRPCSTFLDDVRSVVDRGREARSRGAAPAQGGDDRHARRGRRGSNAGTSPTTASGCASSATPSTRKSCASTSRAADARLAARTSAALYGVRFEAAAVPVWHEDVRYFDVTDAADRRVHRRHLPRPLPARRQVQRTPPPGRCAARARRAGRTPIIVLVTNFNREGLTHDELETLLPRVRPRAARRALGHATTTRTPARACSATSSRRRRRCTRSGRAARRPSRSSRGLRRAARLIDASQSTRLNAARRFGAGHRTTRGQLLLRLLRHGALDEDPQPPLDVVEAHGGRHAAGLRRRARVPRHLRAHRQSATPPATTATCGRR